MKLSSMVNDNTLSFGFQMEDFFQLDVNLNANIEEI